jgi:hypothetical protein
MRLRPLSTGRDPGAGSRIWLVDEMYNGHAELVPGMTVEELDAAWVDHSEHPPDVGRQDRRDSEELDRSWSSAGRGVSCCGWPPGAVLYDVAGD